MENPPATTPEWIAHHAVICRSADGTEHPVVISIGRPYDTGQGDWACPVETAGLHGRHPDMMGVDSLQALCLALSLARKILEDFVEKGGSLIDPDSREEWSLQDLRAVFGADTHLGRPRP